MTPASVEQGPLIWKVEGKAYTDGSYSAIAATRINFGDSSGWVDATSEEAKSLLVQWARDLIKDPSVAQPRRWAISGDGRIGPHVSVSAIDDTTSALSCFVEVAGVAMCRPLVNVLLLFNVLLFVSFYMCMNRNVQSNFTSLFIHGHLKPGLVKTCGSAPNLRQRPASMLMVWMPRATKSLR